MKALAFAGLCLEFLMLLLKKYFESSALKAEKDKEYKISQEDFNQMALAALLLMKNQASDDSALARSIEDQIDAELARRKASPPLQS